MKKILIGLFILISLFIFASCSSDPAEDVPSPGSIPSVPSAGTTIKSVASEDKVAMKTVLDDLQLIIKEITEGGKDILSDPALSLKGTVMISALGQYSIKVGGVTLQSSSLSATLKADDKGIILSATSTVKIGDAAAKILRVSFDIDKMEATIKLGTDETLLSNIGDDTVVTLNGKVLNEDELDEFADKMEPVAIAVLNALMNANISFYNFVGSYAIPDVGTVTVTASGSIKLDASLNPTYFETEKGSIITSGSISFKNFDFEVGLDDVTGGLIIDDMTISVGSVAIDGGPSFSAGLKAKEISLFVKHSNLAKANLVISNTDIEVSYDSAFAMKLSTDIGFGIMVGTNSMGFLTNVSFDSADMGDFDPETDLSINPKAATLNGSYYDPEQFLAALIEVGSETFGD